MKQYIEDGIRVLEADEGKWLTDGETYTQKVYLGINASPDDWSEVDEKPEYESD